jgi:hypothetical protein
VDFAIAFDLGGFVKRLLAEPDSGIGLVDRLSREGLDHRSSHHSLPYNLVYADRSRTLSETAP